MGFLMMHDKAGDATMVLANDVGAAGHNAEVQCQGGSDCADRCEGGEELLS